MKESPSLAELLMNQRERKSGFTDLTDKAPVLPFLPPFLLKNDYVSPTQGPKFHFQFFPDKTALKASFPNASIHRGHPYGVYQFLAGTDDVFLDFDKLGLVRLSRSPSEEGKNSEQMKKWLNYALSPELWGPEGKWTRLHERLCALFEKHNLLDRTPLPGYYPLKSSGRTWEKYPFKGDHQKDGLVLVLPWTFSLSELQSFEALINEEN